MKIIIISGPSGSGKTTLSEKIAKRTVNSIILNTDNYYKSDIKSKILSKIIYCYFDRKLSFNFKLLDQDLDFILKKGYANFSYEYDFKNKSIKKNIKKVKDIKLVIIEGIFAKEVIKKYSQKINLLVELNPRKIICMKRVLKRDFLERGKNKNNIYRDFSKGWEIFYSKKKNNNYKDSIKNILIQEEGNVDLILKKIKKKN